MNIIPDPLLVALQMLPFLALMLGLRAILFKPMLDYLDERATATVGSRKEAEGLQERAGTLLTQWEAAIAKAHGEIADFRAARRAVANQEYQRVIAEARREAESRISDAVLVIRGEAALAREELRGASRLLAGDVVAQVLGRPTAQMEA